MPKHVAACLVVIISVRCPDMVLLQVNAAVQESLMEAAVASDADTLEFNDFVQLMRINSSDSLASELSYDLYDPRVSVVGSLGGAGGSDGSLHGLLGSSKGGFLHSHPPLGSSGMVSEGGAGVGHGRAPALEAIQDVTEGDA